MDRTEGESVTAQSKIRSVFILLFSTTWLVALVAGWVVPRFVGDESPGAKTIDRFRWSTGTRQQWDMFQSIPKLRDFQMELISETMDGERKTYGPVVPDLGAFEDKQAVRYSYAFSRILDDRQEFMNGYVAQAAKSLEGRDPEIARFFIHTISQPTRALERSRKDGILWTTVSEQLGPYPVNHD